MRDRQNRIHERFTHETASHELKVIRDDGLYRHLRCSAPGTWTYGYDIVTWPGYLAIVGDAGDFVFSRTRDMFEFFEADRGRINPDYWAEKLQAPRATDGAKHYSPEAYQQHVREWAADTERDEFGWHDVERSGHGPARDVLAYLDGIEYDWSEGSIQRILDFREQVQEQLLDQWMDWQHSEEGAHRQLREFRFDLGRGRKREILDSWEWDLRDYDGQFLWCCYAIVFAIKGYRAIKAPVAA